MGCGDACPIFPGKGYLDWDLEDPADLGVEAVRPIRDQIRARIEGLLTELHPDQSQPRQPFGDSYSMTATRRTHKEIGHECS